MRRRSATSSRTGCCAVPCSTRPARCRACSCSGGRRVAAVEASDTGAVVALDDGSGCAPGWSPPPTGSESPLRRAAGIGAVEWRYQQIGIVTTVAHDRPHAGIAVEHFLPAGPFAILPMTDEPARPGHAPRGRSSIVWTEHADLAPRLLALPEAGIRRRIARPFRRVSRRDRAGRAALELYAGADAGRALCRARGWR